MLDMIVTGSIAYDYLMRFPGRFKEYILREKLDHISLSFLVDDMTRHYGGVAANIAYTMARLGLRPHLFGTVGKDFGDYRASLEAVGVQLDTVRGSDLLFTASFFVNTDLDNNQIASFYTGAMALAREYTLSDVYPGTPDLVIISPNDPVAMQQIADECRARGIRFMYDPSQQIPRLNGDELRRGVQGAYMMVVNKYEAGMFYERAELSIDDLRDTVEVLVVTHGKDGSIIYIGDRAIEVPIVPTEQAIDPTGGGDAFRAGLLCGLNYGWDWKLAGEVGALCATYALEQVGTQNHIFTPAEFIGRFRQHFADDGALDILLRHEPTRLG